MLNGHHYVTYNIKIIPPDVFLLSIAFLPTSFIFVELDTKKCDSKPSSSSSTVPWITAVSVEGVFLVAATAAIVMLVRKLRVKRTKEGTTYKSATYNLLYENKIADDFWGAQGRCSFKNGD